jgi:hypothetical protein
MDWHGGDQAGENPPGVTDSGVKRRGLSLGKGPMIIPKTGKSHL